MKPETESSDIITQAEFARKVTEIIGSPFSKQRVMKMLREGVLRCRRDRKLNFSESLAAVQAYLKSQNQSDGIFRGKQAAYIKKQMLQCELLEIEISKQRGKLHDKQACCASLTTLFATASAQIHRTSELFKAAFPEAPQSQIDWIANAHDELIARLKGGA